jgi:hypothetical protein
MTAIEANDVLRWKIVQRGFWVNGAENDPLARVRPNS